MKIAVFTTYFDPEENGLTGYINGLYGALLKKHPDIKIDIIAFDTLKTKKPFEKKPNWNVHRLNCIPILGRTYAIPTIRGLRQLKEIFNKNSYAIINTHTRFFLTSYLGVKYGKKYRIPVIHTEHGSDFVKHRKKIIETIAKVYDLTLGKYVLKNAAIVCGVSKSACDFAKKLGAKKMEVVYNGIDTKFWKKTPFLVSPLTRGKNLLASEASRGSSKITFTFVGRLIPEKGVQDLIETLHSLSSRPLSRDLEKKSENISGSRVALCLSGMTANNWELLIVGDGFYRKNLEDLVKKCGLEDKIKFLGTRDQEEIRDILHNTDLFINPSLASEGLPTTILEAAACGCPVLSSDKGGSVEVLEEKNLYPAGNLMELKKKISNYQKIPVPKVDKFNWKNISESYYRIIKKYRP